MDDDRLTHENIISVSFSEHSSAYEALNRLRELDEKGEVSVRSAAVVIRDDDGTVETKEHFGEDSWDGTASGGLVGLVIGVIGGPLGVLIGGATGVLVGSLFDMDDADESESDLADISKSVRTETPALLADVFEENPVAIDAVMTNLGGTVLRRSAADVEAEVAAAEEAQREAKKKAREELREARQKKQKDEVTAKVDDLKTKLGRQKKPAATS